jgi:hypothetical protein
MDDNDRLAGQFGQPMPTGGNHNDWETGRGIKAWNDAELARQNTPFTMPDSSPTSPAPAQTPYSGGGGFRLRVNTGKGFALSGPIGLVLILVVGAPYYYLSIPFWAALYPAAGAVTVLVYIAVYMASAGNGLLTGSGHVVFPEAVAFIAAWILTLGDQLFAANHPVYFKLRHWVRLALIFLWAVYAQSLHTAFTARMPSANPELPPLQWTSTHLLYGCVAVVFMHLYLTHGFKRALNRLRGRVDPSGFEGVR